MTNIKIVLFLIIVITLMISCSSIKSLLELDVKNIIKIFDDYPLLNNKIALVRTRSYILNGIYLTISEDMILENFNIIFKRNIFSKLSVEHIVFTNDRDLELSYLKKYYSDFVKIKYFFEKNNIHSIISMSEDYIYINLDSWNSEYRSLVFLKDKTKKQEILDKGYIIIENTDEKWLYLREKRQ